MNPEYSRRRYMRNCSDMTWFSPDRRQQLKSLEAESRRIDVFNQEISQSSHKQRTNLNHTPYIKWKAGDECVAKYWEDGQLYPARIDHLYVSGKTAVVKFLNFNYEEVYTKHIFPYVNHNELNPPN